MRWEDMRCLLCSSFLASVVIYVGWTYGTVIAFRLGGHLNDRGSSIGLVEERAGLVEKAVC